MKNKTLITTLLVLCFALPMQGQIFKKLKQKAEQAAERTILKKTDEIVTKKTEKTIDDATSEKDKSSEAPNSALNKNKKAKKAFFSEDVVIQLHENGNLNQTQYFDADEVAVRLDQDNLQKPGYIDSEGFMYVFKHGEYTKSSIVALQSQGMMVPTMMLEAYKLPPEPFMAMLQKQHDQGITANPFNGIVEFAFIYKQDDFRYEDYKETTQIIRGEKYTKFELLNEPGYKGNYVLFDTEGRLVEVYSNKLDAEQSMNNITEMSMVPPGKSLLVYNYTPVDVTLPQAREVRMQGQELMEAVMGGVVKDGSGSNSEIDDDDYDTSDSKGMTKRVKKSLNDHKTTVADLPESYDFNWQLETEMVLGDKKKDVMEMTFLINENANYQATNIVDRKSKDMGNATMLFDADLNTMVMFMDAQGSKFLQMYPIPEVGESNENLDNYKISKLPSKTIIGYSCEGLQLEDDRYIIKVYHTADAKIKLSNFMNFGGQNNKMDMPDIDPRVIKQFSNGLILEMDVTDKKKSKNHMNIIAKALKDKKSSIKKSEYKVMDLFSGRSMFKN
ncbi:DUF4412 domain-containing protein [Winogradskyella pulchriflava]|uniref:DUF4412 domain-containing protein n=1 Tax=Winogradskyella pulchriflava TaxID=1110688 RepID=A0ABV6Q7E1_9FLAO